MQKTNKQKKTTHTKKHKEKKVHIECEMFLSFLKFHLAFVWQIMYVAEFIIESK